MSQERIIIESIFRIPDKQGRDVDFILNPYQLRLDSEWTNRNIVPKARRLGISSYVLARFLARCLLHRNRSAVIVSHDTEATQKLLDRIHYMLENAKGAKAVTKYDNRNEITFPKTNSHIYIGTAGSRNFGRGDTITDLHCSEIAFWANPEKLVRGLFQAAEQGEICVESTGNGVGNWYHRQCLRAASGGLWKLHFYNWLDSSDCALRFANEYEREFFLENLDEDLEEVELAKRSLTPEQLHWRRSKIVDEFDSDLRAFKAEYPITLDECFQSTNYQFFQKVNYIPTKSWKRESLDLWLLEGHPHPQLHYVIGADVGGGVGKDYSVAEIYCLEKGEQVGEWRSNRKEPDAFGNALIEIGRRFNNAYLNIERNNHGLTTIKIVSDAYPSGRIHHSRGSSKTGDSGIIRLSQYGTYTSETTRGYMLGNARRMLQAEATIHSPVLHSEIQTFSEQDDGKIEAEQGCHDDTVMATALALLVFERASLSIAEKREPAKTENPFSFESIVKELTEKSHGNWPIPRQDLN